MRRWSIRGRRRRVPTTFGRRTWPTCSNGTTRLYPIRGVSLDAIAERHAWRQLDPTRKQWRVDGLLRGRGVSLLSADPKCGKSTFARCLAVAVAGGEPVFCGRTVEQTPVLFVELDESDETADEHFAEIHIPGAPLTVHFDYGGGLLPANPAERFAWLANWARDERAGIIVIDTLARFTPPPGNNGISDYAMTAPMSLYQRLTEETGAHVVVLHHLAKGAEGARTPLGSQAIAGAVDSLWTMTRRDDGDLRYLEISGRRVELPRTEIRFEDGWVTFGQTVHGRALAEVDNDIIDWVASQSAPVTKNSICIAVKGKKMRLLARITQLADEGKLRRVGAVPGSGNHYAHERFEYPYNSPG